MSPERIERWTPLTEEGESDIDPDEGGDVPVFVRLPLADGGDLIVSPLPDGDCYAPREGKPCIWFQWEPEVHPMPRSSIC